MADPQEKAKIIPITMGRRRPIVATVTTLKGAIAASSGTDSTQAMLAGLHSRVRAVLVERRGKWEYFERIRSDADARSILQDVSLHELLAILRRSAVKGLDGQRITISPWPGFDLAVLLRDGRPCYAACFDPDTSIYIAEATLPEVAGYFDGKRS